MSMLLMVKAMQIKVGNPTRKLVLIKLADNANDQGECWPSYQNIADHCETTRRSVMSHIKALENSGLIRREYRKGSKGNKSNVYHLTLEPGENISPPGENISPPPGENISPRTSHSLEPVNEPKEPMSSKPDNRHFEIFDYWKDVMKKSGNTSLSAKRLKAIKARLKKYTVEEIKLAITNCSNTSHNMGFNDRKTKFNDIELICRNDENLERFRDNPGDMIGGKAQQAQRDINYVASIDDDWSAPDGWED